MGDAFFLFYFLSGDNSRDNQYSRFCTIKEQKREWKIYKMEE